MADLTREFNRRQFLKGAAAAGVAVGVGGIAAACSTAASPTPAASTGGAASSAAAGSPTPGPTGTLNWMTWVDHYYPEELSAIQSSIGIGVNLTELADNADGFTKLASGETPPEGLIEQVWIDIAKIRGSEAAQAGAASRRRFAPCPW